MTPVRAPGSPDVTARAWALGLDVALVEVHKALSAVGVRSILLKGPAIANWLYDDSIERFYTDIDLLIREDSLAVAGAALAKLGFVQPYAGVGASAEPDDHAQMWRRRQPNLGEVDLHHRFAGVNADPAVIWDALSQRTVSLRVAGHDVEVLDHVGLALIIALHAAAHGPEDEWPRQDLARALERASSETWAAAADLAKQLAAEQSFALGLRRLPRGVLLAERLGLTTEVSAHAALLSGGVGSKDAWGFHQFAIASGWRARAVVLREKLLPSRAFMGHWAPWTRRGRSALALGYAWRVLRLIKALPRGARRYRTAWTQANPAAGGRPPRPAEDLLLGLWALRCVRRTRRQLATTRLDELRLPEPPPGDREGVVRATLRAVSASCLVEAAVRQAWLAARGDGRDLIIGVTPSKDNFRAHAWLEGDADGDRAGFTELMRKPPPLRHPERRRLRKR